MDDRPGTAPAPVCYRHPGRPTRLSCSECGRPICAECSHDAAVGQKCPVCAGPKERTRVVRASSIKHADRRTTPLTLALIAVNVAIWVIGFVAPDLRNEILDRFAQQRFLIDAGEWWRGITAMFLHSQSSVFHILFNMWALWIFGPVLERRWGSLPFGALYLAAGITGSALYHAMGSVSWVVGASGAIFGLFGALLFLTYRQRHTVAGRAIFTQLGVLLAINLTLPFVLSGIAWEAHVGGLVAGGAIAFAWERLPRSPHARWQRALVALCVAGASLGVLILG